MNKRCLKEYRIWKAMKSRCYAPSQTKGNYKKFHITVCDEWKHDFNRFMSDMGPLPDESYSIERIYNTKGYSPDNCKWIPQRNQPKNRTTSKFYTINGVTMCLKDWARCFGIKYTTLYYGLFRYGKTLSDYIPNDLKAVDTAIRDYYGMGEG